MQALRSITAHIQAHDKARVMQALLILSPSIGDPPRMQGSCSNIDHLQAPEKAGLM